MRMVNNVLITEADIESFLEDENLASKAKALLAQQKTVWPLLRKGYESLDSVEVRTFEFDGFQIKVQFNPGRITSSAAKVDAKSIQERKCFLCYKNLPGEQRGILAENNYLILCNPFPIFTEHFTIPHIDHIAQEILNSFDKFISFSKDLGKYYTLFYNGPKCGASAPDHLHFQAGNKQFMPMDTEYDSLKNTLGKKIIETEGLSIFAVDRYPARFFAFESSDPKILSSSFEKFYRILKDTSATDEEPMMNILSSYENEIWRVIVFPRSKHRPSYYFAEGDDNILLSPASVDMGGVLITPLEKDFKKITKDNIVDIFSQVTIEIEKFDYITKNLVDKYKI